MIDPLVSLAFSVYSKKGVYALLLGSGISRASGIPTGWEIVCDLIRKLAKLEDASAEPDPAKWFLQKHGHQPEYGKLLDSLVKTSSERQLLLHGYFEPTKDEREKGLKSPTAAHKAIAQLISGGYVRVVITTNFDRLLERALEEIGVTPTVVSSTDHILGAMPLVHSGPTIIKVHGDYLDTRIKNTESELMTYDALLNQLLERVFNEYGLIVCGWSADWDHALRTAMEKAVSRRFSMYWTTRSPVSDNVQQLVARRSAEIIQIHDANQFFESLREKVHALEDLAGPHPMSPKMAVATVKDYLVDPAKRIKLHDLVHEETEKLYAELNEKAFPPVWDESGGDAIAPSSPLKNPAFF
ncbi:MAG TPA: SIR2 family protein [Verrucomicrobiae bacterium]|nr:SIR2 family protein [Verrucomicrobiae bacterium]